MTAAEPLSIYEQIQAAIVTFALDGHTVGDLCTHWSSIEVGQHVWEQLEKEGTAVRTLVSETAGVQSHAHIFPNGWRVRMHPRVNKRGMRVWGRPSGLLYGGKVLQADLKLKPRPQSSCYAERKLRKQRRKLNREQRTNNS